MTEDKNEFEVIYQYKWRRMPLYWLSFIMALSVGLGWVAFQRDGWRGGLIVLCSGLAFSTLIGWLLFQSLADVCISDNEVTRRVLRWTWQHMRWADVVRLTIVPTTNVDTGLKVRAFTLRGSKSTSFFSRQITFQERPGEMNQLLSRLEACVAKHHISVREL